MVPKKGKTGILVPCHKKFDKTLRMLFALKHMILYYPLRNKQGFSLFLKWQKTVHIWLMKGVKCSLYLKEAGMGDPGVLYSKSWESTFYVFWVYSSRFPFTIRLLRYWEKKISRKKPKSAFSYWNSISKKGVCLGKIWPIPVLKTRYILVLISWLWTKWKFSKHTL